MVADRVKNIVAFSDYFRTDYPQLYEELERILKSNNIECRTIQGTADYWSRDYMPVQVNANKCVRFQYTPDYLDQQKSYRTLVTNVMVHSIAPKMEVEDCSLVVDGGNVVCNNNCVVMTEKVFSENPRFSQKEIVELLSSAFETDNIVFVPWEGKRYDKFGHTDGMLRFVSGDNCVKPSVLVNQSVYGKRYATRVRDILNRVFNVIDLELSVADDMSWAYINYLMTENVIIVPGVDSPNDQVAFNQLERIFPEYKGRIFQVQMRDFINRGGGALNCCSWTIQSTI